MSPMPIDREVVKHPVDWNGPAAADNPGKDNPKTTKYFIRIKSKYLGNK